MTFPLRALHGWKTTAWLGAALLSASASAQPCDTTFVVGFTRMQLEPYIFQFSPDIDTAGHDITGLLWQFSDGGAPYQSIDDFPIVDFPGPGYQLSCLTATAEFQGDPCQSTHCELVDVPLDTTGCGDVINDFTIEYSNPDIIFISTSSSLSPIDQYTWDFGDGTTGSGTPVTHAYAEFGAYHVCLTIISGNCITTHCRWLYLGPTQLPCDTLLDPAFNLLTVDRTVAVIDASAASGMDIQVNWDFGDGYAAYGLTAIHTYAFDGVYTICAAVGVDGTLVQDSCVVTVCQDVQVFAVTAAGIDEGSLNVLRVYPTPFEDVVSIACDPIEPGTAWELMDPTGRCLESGACNTTGLLELDLSHIASGPLFVRLRMGDRLVTARLLKN